MMMVIMMVSITMSRVFIKIRISLEELRKVSIFIKDRIYLVRIFMMTMIKNLQ